MQVARISAYKNQHVVIPALFQEAFHLFGGEQVSLFPVRDKNCLWIFMAPIPQGLPGTLRRFKATVSDQVGASSALYKAIESNHQAKILSAQGTTTGRDASAVGDIVLDVSCGFDDIRFALDVLQGSRDCTITDLREYQPSGSVDLDSLLRDMRPAHVGSDGQELHVRHQVMSILGQDTSDKTVIINWDTETTVLALTFVRASDKIGSLILFLRDNDDQRHTGEVGEILGNLGVDFLWLQINHIGHASEIPFLRGAGDGDVKRWVIVADFSKAVATEKIANATKKITKSLEDSKLFYGGLIGVQSGEPVLFGRPEIALTSINDEVREGAKSLQRWVKRLWSAEY
jgi:hypothetical protein